MFEFFEIACEVSSVCFQIVYEVSSMCFRRFGTGEQCLGLVFSYKSCCIHGQPSFYDATRPELMLFIGNIRSEKDVIVQLICDRLMKPLWFIFSPGCESSSLQSYIICGFPSTAAVAHGIELFNGFSDLTGKFVCLCCETIRILFVG